METMKLKETRPWWRLRKHVVVVGQGRDQVERLQPVIQRDQLSKQLGSGGEHAAAEIKGWK